MKPKLYLSSPIKDRPKKWVHKRFKHCEKVCKTLYETINPYEELGLFSEGDSELRRTMTALKLLRPANGIYMMFGWQNSKRCLVEHAYAKKHGKVIIYENPQTRPCE